MNRLDGQIGDSQSGLLSIIIVNWNTQELLGRCLASLARDPGLAMQEPAAPGGGACSGQGDRRPLSTEVFVVDNASADGSVGMVRERFPWVRLLENEENLGFAAANNRALIRAQGRYVLLLNSDAVARESGLADLIEFADAHAKAGIVGVKLLNEDGSFQAGMNDFPTLGSVLLETWGILQKLKGNPYYPSYPPDKSVQASRCDWVGGACLLARRSAIDQVGLLDEGFFMNCEEVDWCYRMKNLGWEVWFAPQVEVVHLGGGSADRWTSPQRVQSYRSKLRYLRKRYGPMAEKAAYINYRAASLVKAVLYLLRSFWTGNDHCREQARSHWQVAVKGSWS